MYHVFHLLSLYDLLIRKSILYNHYREDIMVRYHIFVEGRVQGVGFRYFVLMHAQSYGLTGSVKNLDNGLVEIYVQGESDTIDQFLATIIKGDGRFIKVDDYSCKAVPIIPDERRFSCQFY